MSEGEFTDLYEIFAKTNWPTARVGRKGEVLTYFDPLLCPGVKDEVGGVPGTYASAEGEFPFDAICLRAASLADATVMLVRDEDVFLASGHELVNVIVAAARYLPRRSHTDAVGIFADEFLYDLVVELACGPRELREVDYGSLPKLLREPCIGFWRSEGYRDIDPPIKMQDL